MQVRLLLWPKTPVLVLNFEFRAAILAMLGAVRGCMRSASTSHTASEATIADYQMLDGTRTGVTCISETIDFAVAATWY